MSAAKPAIVDLETPATAERVEVIAGPAPAADPWRHKRTRKSEVAVCGTPTKQENLDDGMDFNCPRCWRIYTRSA